MAQPLRKSQKVWILLFGVWLLLLSGVFNRILGSPGVLQAYRLRSLLQDKRDSLTRIENEVATLKKEALELETNRQVQEREARRILGYVASDELSFDFSTEF